MTTFPSTLKGCDDHAGLAGLGFMTVNGQENMTAHDGAAGT